ncbi:hypothetical protein VPH35_070024 [Triticum aestivum]
MTDLPHDLIVSEILVRMPVKSLLRLSCVCKAWRTTISDDPSFSQAHLHRLHQQNKRPYSLLIAPRITVEAAAPRLISHEVSSPGLYLWEESKPDVATLLRDTSSFHAEDMWVRHRFAHCDGLVRLPHKGYCKRAKPSHAPGRLEGHQAFGFGRDRCANAYKVARFFYRECLGEDALGMEVFTIEKDDSWREAVARPSFCFVAMQTAIFFKGSLIWTVDHESLMYEDLCPDEIADMPCFVRFRLEDELFNIITGPSWYRGPNKFKPGLAELNGELAMPRPGYESVKIWMCGDVESISPPRWERRHVLNFPFSFDQLIGMSNDEIVFRDMSDSLWRQTRQQVEIMFHMEALRYYNHDTGTLVEYSGETVQDFDVIFYIPTLVPI